MCPLDIKKVVVMRMYSTNCHIQVFGQDDYEGLLCGDSTGLRPDVSLVLGVAWYQNLLYLKKTSGAIHLKGEGIFKLQSLKTPWSAE